MQGRIDPVDKWKNLQKKNKKTITAEMTAGMKSFQINVAPSWQLRQQLVSCCWMVTALVWLLHRFNFQSKISHKYASNTFSHHFSCFLILPKVDFHITTDLLWLNTTRKLVIIAWSELNESDFDCYVWRRNCISPVTTESVCNINRKFVTQPTWYNNLLHNPCPWQQARGNSS